MRRAAALLAVASACGQPPSPALVGREPIPPAPIADAGAGVGAGEQAPPPPPRPDRFGRSARDHGAPRRIAGTVTIGHAPVSAHVELHPTNQPGTSPVIRVEAGDDGVFDFGEQPRDSYTIVAWRDDTPATQLPVYHVDPLPLDHLELPVMPCIRRVHGTIADPAGAPIAGATVREQPYGPRSIADDAGRYDLCVADHGTVLGFSAAGHGTVVHAVPTQGSPEHDVTLAPEVRIEGVVRDPDGVPVPWALVLASSQPVGATRTTTSITSAIADAEGRFRFDGLAPRLAVSALTATHDADWTKLDTQPGGSYTQDLTIVPGVRVSGRVTAADTTPVAGARVIWAPSSQNGDIVLTAADGRFSFENVGTGDAVAGETIFVAEHELVAITPSREGGLEGMTLHVSPSPRVRGRVVHDGQPVAGATVYVYKGPRTTTRVDGTFSIEAEGVGALQAFSAPLMAFGSLGKVGGERGYPTDEVEIDLAYRATASGVLVDEAGSPIAGAYITVRNVSDTDGEQAFTGEDGTFLITRMRGGERYDATVYTSADRLNTYPPAKKAKLWFDVKDAQSNVTGLTLRVRREPQAVKP